MYSRKHQKPKPAASFHNSKTKNPDAPPRFFVQPLTSEENPDLQNQSAPKQDYESHFWDVSIFTTNRPPDAPKPKIQRKLSLTKSGAENQTPETENNFNKQSRTSKEVATGIAQETAITRFSGAAKAVQDNWSKQTPEERINALGDLVNKELQNINSYPCRIKETQNLGAIYGIFQYKSWELFLNNKLLSSPTINTEEMAGILEAIYHEGRHAEQWYRMARWRAGMGKTAPDIAKEMEIPKNVAEAAVKNPLKPLKQGAKKPPSNEDIKQQEKEIQEVKEWYNSAYGDKKQYRLDTFSELYKTRNEFEQAVADLKAKEVELAQATIAIRQADKKLSANPNDQNAIAEYEQALTIWQQKTAEFNALKKLVDKLKRATDQAYAKYEKLPEEADAFSVGGKVASTYKKPKNKEIEK